MQKNILWRKITLFALVAILCLQMLVFFPINAHAEGTEITSYDDTAIEDDLSNIDLANYPANPLGECDIISFMEYCYSEDDYPARVYGLYVYVYNPTKKAITSADGYNSVNTLIGYDQSGEAVFDKVNLEYLDKTNDNLFYKFKLSRPARFLDMARTYASAHEGVRRYEIIEFEVSHGAENATTAIEKVYEWSGYASYCGADSSPVSTLTCKDYGARSIHLELKQTNYRFATQGDGLIRDELNSVFFTIPEEYFQEFGNLNKISAEWYEYKTDYMFVTDDKDAYSGLWRMRNVLIDEYGRLIEYNNEGQAVIIALQKNPWRVFWEGTWPTVLDPFNPNVVVEFSKSFNVPKDADIGGWKIFYDGDYYHYINFADGWTPVNQLDWLFYNEKATTEEGVVSKEEVQEYMRKYTSTFYDQERILNRYASELFAPSIDEDRLQYLDDNCERDDNGDFKKDADGNIKWSHNASSGLVKMNFFVDNTKNEGNTFVNADSTQSWWNRFWYGTKYEEVPYSPIVVIEEGDLYLDNDSFSEKYYVNKVDVSTIIADAEAAYDNGERPVLLRFAVTDYYSSKAAFDNPTGDKKYVEHNGYVAQETVFLDFDVLSLGFKDAEGYNEVVIGVVAEPIDIINGLTPPEDPYGEFFQMIMIVLGIILIFVVIIFLWPIVSPFFRLVISGALNAMKIVVKILLIPLRIITKPFRE